MGRVKIAPTPRAASLNDAMRAAATQISPPTAEAMRNDFANSSKSTKPAGRNSLPTPRGSQDRANSEPAGKRKAVGESKTPSVPPTKDTKLALRSSATVATSTLLALANGSDATELPTDGPPSKRQKVAKSSPGPRRSNRSKTAGDEATPPNTKSLRSSSRAQRLSSTITEETDDGKSTPASEGQAVTDPAETPFTAGDGSVSGESAADGAVQDPDSLPSPSSAISDPMVMAALAPRHGSGPPPRETMSLPPPSGHISDVVVLHKVEPGEDDKQLATPSVSNGIPHAQVLGMPGQQVHYGIPPAGAWVQASNGDYVQVGATGIVSDGKNNSQSPGVGTTPGASLLPHGASPGGLQGQPVQYFPSRRGQKVKGRPQPKKASSSNTQPESQAAQSPETNDEDLEAKNRALANTYPRKQPFKAQIEFPGYPPPNTEVPGNYTMWDMCQLMPNSLRENNLRAFVQREWSANELCACLKDDVRAILNARPGKDKTMVFQKRMERIKKDLVAKGEYETLLRAPPLRDDGRPTWVKRGNVRRK